MRIMLVEQKIEKSELDRLAQERFGDMVKAVVDIARSVMMVGGDLYRNRTTNWNFGCVKAPGFNDKKGVNINSNMDPFFIVEPRELSRGPNFNLLPDCGKHADAEALLLEQGSKQRDLWGI